MRKPELESLNKVHYTGFLLALTTALIHFELGFRFGYTSFLGFSFILAGLGFLTGITLVAYSFKKRLVYLIGIPFTAGQIVLWYVMNQPSLSLFLRGEPLLEFVDKISQTGLIIILLVLLKHETEYLKYVKR